MTTDRYAVVHSMHLWLSQTMTWLHTQVRSLPDRIDSHVVCDRVANLDQFPVANLVSADHDTALRKFASRHAWPIARRRHDYLLARQLRHSRAKILHSHFGDRGWANIDLAGRLGTRHGVTFYGYDVGRLPRTRPEWQRRYTELFESASLLLCEGPFIGQTLVQLGCPTKKIQVHHLGVEVARIPFFARAWRPGTILRVLIAGTFTEKKGFTYAIEALSGLVDTVALEVLVVGDSDSIPERQAGKKRIHATVEATKMHRQVRFLGYQTHANLHDIARGCHIFLSPSVTASDGDSEGEAPVAIIEMVASGMPVISTRHCDIPGVIEDGVSGLLADEREVDGLADRMRWLLHHPEAWHALTFAVRRRIEAEFDAVTQGPRLAAHYDRAVCES